MARNLEYIKKSEARILIMIEVCDNQLKCGKKIAEKLKIDYIYVMKLLSRMYDKGWLQTHQYNFTTYFNLSRNAPIQMAKEIYINPQVKLKTQNDNRKIQESNMETQGNGLQQPVQQ